MHCSACRKVPREIASKPVNWTDHGEGLNTSMSFCHRHVSGQNNSDNSCFPSSTILFHEIMRRTILLLLALLIPCIASAQEKAKYWIFLTDKPDALAKSEQVEETYLTNKAVARRALRGEPDLATRFAIQDAPISQDYEADLKRRGIKIEQRSRWLNAVTARLSEDEIKHISALPYVRSTQQVALLSSDAQPSAPISSVVSERVSSNCPSSIFGRSCTQLDVVNAIPVIERGINGKGVILGFIDAHFGTSGNKPFTHPSLEHIRNDNRLVRFRDFTQSDPTQVCPRINTHGMAVASVAVGYKEGQLIGPGYGATIYAAATECGPYERNVEEDNFVAAVEWMESEGVDVITASLGYYDFDPGQRSYTKDDLDGDTGLTTIALDWAAQRGVVTVSSAGNAGPSPQTVYTPADGDSVISVGGVWPDRSIVFFSSRGPTADGRTKPDVSGQAIRVWLGAGSEYDSSQGTSFSAPMIAGVVTQILQVNPDLKPRDVWRVLTSTASQSSSPDNNLGWGIVDADAAVRKAATFATDRVDEFFPAPDQLTVQAPYPNPFHDIAHFTIESSRSATHARLAIFDVLGREVATAYHGSVRVGATSVQFNGQHLPPGVYAYRLESEGRIQSGTMTRLGH